MRHLETFGGGLEILPAMRERMRSTPGSSPKAGRFSKFLSEVAWRIHLPFAWGGCFCFDCLHNCYFRARLCQRWIVRDFHQSDLFWLSLFIHAKYYSLDCRGRRRDARVAQL